MTDDTGAFWFFDPENVELAVKVLDGRAINGRFWVYFGALTDVGYTLRVTDTAATSGFANPDADVDVDVDVDNDLEDAAKRTGEAVTDGAKKGASAVKKGAQQTGEAIQDAVTDDNPDSDGDGR